MSVSSQSQSGRNGGGSGSGEVPPRELVELMERVRVMPPEVRAALEPIITEAQEQARFRGRALVIAREALLRLRLDLEMARFDLDVTRREREDLRRLLSVF